MNHRHIISILVADRFGALSRIIEIFGSRGYNLDSISSGSCEEENCQRLTIVCRETDQNIAKIIKLISELVDVYKVSLMDKEISITRELLLAKVSLKPETKNEIFSLLTALKAEVIEIQPKSISFELVGRAAALDQFMESIRPYEIIELSRTGEAAIHH